jgi:ergothioneine biosynthesis protein EgtC
MCRFVLYLGEPLTLDALTTKPAHSLIHQSYKARERAEPLNGDGFGIAWYVSDLSDEPALYRSTKPAWNNPNLRELARVTRSGCVMAHVRAATPPLPVTQLNCHPFKHGAIAWMHNGFIPGFVGLRRELMSQLSDEAFNMIDGSTDSQLLLAMFVDRHAKTEGSEVGRLAEALQLTIANINEICAATGHAAKPHLNIAVSNGRCAVVSRCCLDEPTADSLYVHRGKAYVCEAGVCRMVATEADTGAVIVASEPLSTDPGWELVPVNHLVVIDQNRAVTIVPVTDGRIG